MSDDLLSRRHLAGLAVGAGAGAVAAATIATPAAAYIANPELPWFDIKAEWGGPGAVGNGSADDTAAIARAITAAGNAPDGGVVFVPAGRFKITGPVQFPNNKMVSLVGTGKWYSRFVCASATAGLRFADLGGGNASAMPMISGIWVDGDGLATTAVNLGLGSNRRMTDVQITDSGTGLLVEQAQNTLFDDILVTGCTTAGVVLDYGAGGNTFFMIQARNNVVNVVFRNSWNGTGSMIYSGRPTDNKFISCLIEGGAGEQTTIQVDHAAGLDNRFIGMGFAGNGPKVRMRHQQPGSPGGYWGSFNLHLTHCHFLGAVGVEHTANGGMLRMTAPKFLSLTTAFVLGNGCYVELDHYEGVAVTTRFANAPGATDPEELLIRRTASHSHNIFTPAATNVAYRAWVDGATQPSYQVKTSGETGWGPGGSTAPDVKLRRSAANRLLVERGDGAATTQPTLLVKGGLGVGNSANGTTLGSVVKKIQVFDAAGTSLGWIPVYNSIT